MAPVAVQCAWLLRIAQEREQPRRTAPTEDERRRRFAPNLDTCHVWARDGELIQKLERGEEIEQPRPITERLESLGIDPAEWRQGRVR